MCVCLCEKERERERVREWKNVKKHCKKVNERGTQSLCTCVCKRGRERERERERVGYSEEWTEREREQK